MVNCCVLGCKSRTERKYENITFHTKGNMISKITIPRLSVTSQYILGELEEMQREEIFRFKLVKHFKDREKASREKKGFYMPVIYSDDDFSDKPSKPPPPAPQFPPTQDKTKPQLPPRQDTKPSERKKEVTIQNMPTILDNQAPTVMVVMNTESTTKIEEGTNLDRKDNGNAESIIDSNWEWGEFEKLENMSPDERRNRLAQDVIAKGMDDIPMDLRSILHSSSFLENSSIFGSYLGEDGYKSKDTLIPQNYLKGNEKLKIFVATYKRGNGEYDSEYNFRTIDAVDSESLRTGSTVTSNLDTEESRVAHVDKAESDKVEIDVSFNFIKETNYITDQSATSKKDSTFYDYASTRSTKNEISSISKQEIHIDSTIKSKDMKLVIYDENSTQMVKTQHVCGNSIKSETLLDKLVRQSNVDMKAINFDPILEMNKYTTYLTPKQDLLLKLNRTTILTEEETSKPTQSKTNALGGRLLNSNSDKTNDDQGHTNEINKQDREEPHTSTEDFRNKPSISNAEGIKNAESFMYIKANKLTLSNSNFNDDDNRSEFSWDFNENENFKDQSPNKANLVIKSSQVSNVCNTLQIVPFVDDSKFKVIDSDKMFKKNPILLTTSQSGLKTISKDTVESIIKVIDTVSLNSKDNINTVPTIAPGKTPSSEVESSSNFCHKSETYVMNSIKSNIDTLNSKLFEYSCNTPEVNGSSNYSKNELNDENDSLANWSHSNDESINIFDNPMSSKDYRLPLVSFNVHKISNVKANNNIDKERYIQIGFDQSSCSKDKNNSLYSDDIYSYDDVKQIVNKKKTSTDFLKHMAMAPTVKQLKKIENAKSHNYMTDLQKVCAGCDLSPLYQTYYNNYNTGDMKSEVSVEKLVNSYEIMEPMDKLLFMINDEKNSNRNETNSEGIAHNLSYNEIDGTTKSIPSSKSSANFWDTTSEFLEKRSSEAPFDNNFAIEVINGDRSEIKSRVSKQELPKSNKSRELKIKDSFERHLIECNKPIHNSTDIDYDTEFDQKENRSKPTKWWSLGANSSKSKNYGSKFKRDKMQKRSNSKRKPVSFLGQIQRIMKRIARALVTPSIE